nr:MAG TPA: hypothetical protein [Caudoviricetes sp.]
MTLQEVRQLVRKKLDDLEYDGDNIDQAINSFIAEVLNNNRIAFMETTTAIPFSAGAIDIPLPTDHQVSLNAVVRHTGLPSYSIWRNRMEYSSFTDAFPDPTNNSPARVCEWCYYGNKIRLSAPADTDGTLILDYVKRPAPATQDNPTLVIPDNYKQMVVNGATVQIMKMNEDYQEAAQEADDNDALITTFVRNESRAMQHVGPIRMKSNRRGGAGWR